LPPIKVPYGILENSLEQQRQFFRGLVGILLNELCHRILNDVQCKVFIVHREQRLFIGAPFGFNQKIRDFLSGSQDDCLYENRNWAGGKQ
jgi:hypothetical protein